MKKKLPMKGDPMPEWLRKKPMCTCSRPATRNLNGLWACEPCFYTGTEMIDLLNAPLKTRRGL